MIKKVIITLAVILAFLFAVTLTTGVVLYRKPSVKFILAMTDIIEPGGITSRETSLFLNGKTTPIMVFEKKGVKTDRYYFCLHGVTPQSNRHSSLQKLAIAIAGSTGRTVLLPHIQGSETGRSIDDATRDIADVYEGLRRQYPGSFNAFGACFAGTGLLIALKHVPIELYPEKIFMYGPFLNGKILSDFYNSAGIEVDYLVKMSNAIRSKAMAPDEKRLISKAIIATKPGTTDRDEMKRILGEELYRKVDELKIDNQEFSSINEYSLFPKNKRLPQCRYFISHSRNDNIIPYSMGLGLHQYFTRRGLTSRFLSTGVFQHSATNGQLSLLFREFWDMVRFLDELFEETPVK